ncbi:murein hydrolase activator EnvC precursor [bacterium BMS3Abin05]|nr:murein hydrolase activator EnvC precursor [bacterium BMS3Abin05]GBE28449.1 murein hydrolase activator EnvC precursor [bacterium BMS3Bbin03]HDL78336.1 hypothetical protein [Bacteroidota bacterium]
MCFYKQKIAKFFLAFFLLGVLFSGSLSTKRAFAQSASSKPQQKKLTSIRQEIHKYRKKYQTSKKKEASTLEKLGRTEREIDLIHTLLQRLSVEETRQRNQIFKQNRELLKLTADYQTLKRDYTRRVVRYYKEGPLLDLEVLLSAKSINQALVWLKYRKRIMDADKRRIETLKIQKLKIAGQTNRLRKSWERQKLLIAEKKRERRNLSIQRRRRKKLLAKIRNNKKIYAQKIKEYKEAEAAIKRLIRLNERTRTATANRRTEVSRFAALKGRLPWPTRGRIINHYGRVKNKKLNTIQENIGIDIKAPFGTPVRSAAAGVVTAITWQRSRGNILIIDHYGGYYTVYAHLSEISVVPGQKVRRGEEIGKVGNSGSLTGAMLHFEIWKNTKIINPEIWLKRRG